MREEQDGSGKGIERRLSPWDDTSMTPNEESIAHRHPAILLLGPTGTGKTPLGNVFVAVHSAKPALHEFGGFAMKGEWTTLSN
jgi:hypothetical protein